MPEQKRYVKDEDRTLIGWLTSFLNLVLVSRKNSLEQSDYVKDYCSNSTVLCFSLMICDFYGL